MEIKWYGTAALSFTAGEETILFDPFISMNPSVKFISLQELASLGDIFITHGHFDHLMDVPAILRKGHNKVYCSEVAALTLQREGIGKERIICIKAGDTIRTSCLEIKVLKGKHITFDRALIVQTMLNSRTFKYFRELCKIIRAFIRYPKGEMLVFLISDGEKSVLHLGSLGLSQDEKYPENVDLMTVPFQGRSDIDDYALVHIKLIKPKAILLHHFDDSFPPISASIPVEEFVKKFIAGLPGTKLFVPAPLQSIKLDAPKDGNNICPNLRINNKCRFSSFI